MTWQKKQINKCKIDEVMNNLKVDFIEDRLAYNLRIDKETLNTYIDKDIIKYLTATLLINRNMDNCIDVLNNPKEYILSPKLLVNAEKAAISIAEHLKKKNSYIYIFADYDCDGINAGFVAYDVLKNIVGSMTRNIILKLPSRKEGYGLNINWCEEISKAHKNKKDNVLVITVDNGISKVQEVEFLKQNNIDVIITDHHRSQDEVPNCLIVNPHNDFEKQDDTYKHLSGCGVIFKVLQLVQEQFNMNTMYKYLPNVALTIISDVMPLTKENISIMQYGLDILNSENCPKCFSELFNQKEIDYITCREIGWIIAPMINSCGRMDNVELGFDFLKANRLDVVNITNEMSKLNDSRKNKAKVATAKMVKDYMNNHLNKEDKVFIHISDAPVGILGIIAGKGTELTGKPTFVLNKTNNILHGSSRSINGINLFDLVEELNKRNLIIGYGGHSEAAGLSFYEENLDEIIGICNELIQVEYVDSITDSEEELKYYDEVLELDNLNVIMYALSNIFPMDGKKINNPTFKIENCIIESFKAYESGFLELKIKQGKSRATLTGMGIAQKFTNELLPKLDEKEELKIDIIGELNKSMRTKRYSIDILDIIA